LEIGGTCENGFDRVAEEFAHNFRARGELGAAFAGVVDGRLAVDLWGGVADSATGSPWAEDTLQLIFSGAKEQLARDEAASIVIDGTVVEIVFGPTRAVYLVFVLPNGDIRLTCA
jgi:hypothetical protein